MQDQGQADDRQIIQLDLNSQYSKERSILLAERAYRLKKQAGATDLFKVMDDVGDELIRLDNKDRFFDAQVKLEAVEAWTEDLRALAVDINHEDLKQRPLSQTVYSQCIMVLRNWAGKYIQQKHVDSIAIGDRINNALLKIESTSTPTDQKEAINMLLGVLEGLLYYGNQRFRDTPRPDPDRYTHIQLRDMRDTLLMHRMVYLDDLELLKEDQSDEPMFTRIEAARDALDEIYKTIQPVTLS